MRIGELSISRGANAFYDRTQYEIPILSPSLSFLYSFSCVSVIVSCGASETPCRFATSSAAIRFVFNRTIEADLQDSFVEMLSALSRRIIQASRFRSSIRGDPLIHFGGSGVAGAHCALRSVISAVSPSAIAFSGDSGCSTSLLRVPLLRFR